MCRVISSKGFRLQVVSLRQLVEQRRRSGFGPAGDHARLAGRATPLGWEQRWAQREAELAHLQKRGVRPLMVGC
jgi:hypothetical protein